MRTRTPDGAGWLVPGPPRAVLVAYDASCRSAADLDRAVGLCAATRASLTIVVTRNRLLALAASWVPAVGVIPTTPGGMAACDDACRRAVLAAVPAEVGVRFVVAERTASAALLGRLARLHRCDTVVCRTRAGRRLRAMGLRVLDAPAAARPGSGGPSGGTLRQVDAT